MVGIVVLPLYLVIKYYFAYFFIFMFFAGIALFKGCGVLNSWLFTAPGEVKHTSFNRSRSNSNDAGVDDSTSTAIQEDEPLVYNSPSAAQQAMSGFTAPTSWQVNDWNTTAQEREQLKVRWGDDYNG